MIVIIDYGIGNLHSVSKALEKLKVDIGYILPDLVYLDSDITNIIIENLK